MTRNAFVLVLVLVLVLAAGCDRGAGANSAPAPAKGPSRAFAVTVDVARPERLVYRIEALGEIEADEVVEVAAEVEGVLGPLAFREGDRVTPETVLVEVDPIRYRLEVDRAAAGVSRTAAELKEREAVLERRRELRVKEEGWVPEEEIVRHEAGVAGALAALHEAESTLGLARHSLQRSQVRPPIAGEIEKRLVNAGQWVQRGTGIATIVKTRPLRLKFTLTEEESARERAGQTVQFRVPAYPAETFSGEIFFVARTANPRTRRVESIARVPNEDGRLKPGFFARIEVETAAREDAILLPETAIRATEAGFVAFVVEEQKPGPPTGEAGRGGYRARRRVLETGLRTADGRVEVRSGVAAGETYVVRGAGMLEDGSEVKIEDAPGAAAERKP